MKTHQFHFSFSIGTCSKCDKKNIKVASIRVNKDDPCEETICQECVDSMTNPENLIIAGIPPQMIDFFKQISQTFDQAPIGGTLGDLLKTLKKQES